MFTRIRRWVGGALNAHIVTAAATTIAVLLGLYSYLGSADLQAEAEAVNLLDEHWKLSDDHPLLASELPDHKAMRVEDGIFDRNYVRLGAHALFTAEAAYKLAGGRARWYDYLLPGDEESRKEAWNATILDLARRHDTFVLSYDFPCEQYEPRFIEFLKSESDRFSKICPAMTDADQDAIHQLSIAAKLQERFYRSAKLNRKYYTEDTQEFIDARLEQSRPPVKVGTSYVLDEVNVDVGRQRYYYCMHAQGGAYEYFRITPYEDEPVPGSCG